MSTLAEILPILGGSLLLFVLIAGVAGTAFGYLAARGPVQRLNKLSEATRAWSQGDFTVSVDDPTGDELGQLAYRLNQMARQLEHLLDTQRELAVVEERNRLARDLHDSAKQQAFAAAAQVGAARALLKQDPDTAETYMEEAERLIYELRQELTALIQELRPAALEGKGLATAVREYGALWSRQSGIKHDVRISGERTLPLVIEQTLFRIMQEALANVSRHSEASNVAIGLDYVNGHISLTVADDGRGFDINGEQTGIGLVSMRERAEVLGGTLSIESSLNKGTTILCTIPVTASDTNGQEEAHE
jgi:NarL family two-component system sensor histidine kinase LiaS